MQSSPAPPPWPGPIAPRHDQEVVRWGASTRAEAARAPTATVPALPETTSWSSTASACDGGTSSPMR